jgi:hypothetical protein
MRRIPTIKAKRQPRGLTPSSLCSLDSMSDEVDAAYEGGGGGSGSVTARYNVKTYGAIGDGATNDAAAIQDAVDACVAAGGGTVQFPRGIYRVNTGIAVRASEVVNTTTLGL